MLAVLVMLMLLPPLAATLVVEGDLAALATMSAAIMGDLMQ
jgi:hypothetical protein